MARDPNPVEVKIKATSDTKGAKEAEKALDGVAKAGDSIREVLGDDLADEFEAVERSARDLRGEVDELVEDSLENLNEATSEIANLQKLEAVERFTVRIADFGSRVEQAGREMEEAGDTGGRAFQQMGQGLQSVSNQIGTVAAGLAAGGPIGGAVAALTVLVEALFNSWADGAARSAREQQELNSEVGRTLDVLRKTRQLADDFRRSMASQDIELALDEQLRKLREQSEELERQNKLAQSLRDLRNEALQNEDQAALAEIDAAVASGNLSEDEANSARAEIRRGAANRADRSRQSQANEAARNDLNRLNEALAAVESIAGALASVEERVSESAQREASTRRLAETAGQEARILNDAAGDISALRTIAAKLFGDDSPDLLRAEAAAAVEAAQKAVEEATRVQEEAAKDLILRDDLIEQLERARRELPRLRDQVDASTQIARETSNTIGRNRASRQLEERARSSSQRERQSGDQEVAALQVVADNLSGLGNASGNAKTILEQGLQRVIQDGRVLEQELPQLVAVINRVLEWIPEREAAQRQDLVTVRTDLERKIEIVESQIRNGRTGQ
ncbi:MAG: hypothetical protein AAGI48_17725 [Verrucomicrobiota bacterium]